MKSFKSFVAEVAQPEPEEEKRFKDQHEYEVINHPVAEPHQHTGEIQKPQKKRPADQEGDANYDKAVKNPEKRMVPESVEEEELLEYSNWTVKAGGKEKSFRARHAGEALRKANKSGHFGNIALDPNKHLRKEEVEEELSPKQKKIDKNKNGKIDGHDLAMLRAKKNEEVEQIDELDKKTLSSYITKASKSAAHKSGMAYRRFGRGTRQDDRAGDELEKKSNKRLAGIATAAKKLAKEEVEITETTTSALKKAVTQTGPDGKTRTVMKKVKNDKTDDHGQDVIGTNESALDEVSKELAQRYKEKAMQSRDKAARDVERNVNRGDYDKAEKPMATQKKRVIGIAKANKVLNKEEVEQINEAVKFKKGPLRLGDGSQVMVSSQDAGLLNQMFKDLSPRNQKEMQKVLMTDKSGFEEIRGFAREAL